jgi:hypothetical protein
MKLNPKTDEWFRLFQNKDLLGLEAFDEKTSSNN